MNVEIKAIGGLFGAEVIDEGIRIGHDDLRRLGTSLLKKHVDGRAQVGAQGCVVLAIWCEFVADLLRNAYECQMDITNALRAGSVTIACRGLTHEDGYITVPVKQFESFVNDLVQRRLPSVVVNTLSFNSRFKSFAHGAGTFAIGRVFAFADIQSEYAAWELRTVQWPAVKTVPPLILEELRGIVTAALKSMEVWRREIAAHPIESRKYSGDEIRDDLRFRAFIDWTTTLAHALKMLVEARLPVLPSGRAEQDASMFVEAFVKARNERDVGHLLRLPSVGPRATRLTQYLDKLLKEVSKTAQGTA